jgi:hypothetical protein
MSESLENTCQKCEKEGKKFVRNMNRERSELCKYPEKDMHMSELRDLVFQRGSLPILVKTTAIGMGSNQVRLGNTRYPMACLYTRETVLRIVYESGVFVRYRGSVSKLNEHQ